MDPKKLALKMKLYKVTEYQIVGPLLFHELFNVSTQLVEGYCEWQGHWCWHLWVENILTDETYDVIKELAPGDFTELKLSKEKPQGVEIAYDSEAQGLLEAYRKDPKKFWSEMPPNVKEFKRTTMKKHKKRTWDII